MLFQISPYSDSISWNLIFISLQFHIDRLGDNASFNYRTCSLITVPQKCSKYTSCLKFVISTRNQLKFLQDRLNDVILLPFSLDRLIQNPGGSAWASSSTFLLRFRLLLRMPTRIEKPQRQTVLLYLYNEVVDWKSSVTRLLPLCLQRIDCM